MSQSEKQSTVYLIPVTLHEGDVSSIPAYIAEAAKQCEVFFVENERSARRFLKLLWRDMVIDNYQWFAIHKAEESVKSELIKALRLGRNIGILSEAGCPGIADPGQILVGVAHHHNAIVKPLVGPSSILLALMASGLNGQRFQFNGYLPIDNVEKMKMLKQIELESAKKDSTQLFIETPYRNNQLFEIMLKTLQPSTFVSVAADLTSPTEFIKTQAVGEWKKNIPDLNKRPAIFSIKAG